MPELVYETQEAVPEAIRSIATEREGKWVANVVPKSELDTFRNNNIAVSTERDGYKTLIGRLTTDVGFDPEKVDEFVDSAKKNADIAQQVADGKLVADSSLEAAVEAKVGAMKTAHQTQMANLETSNRNLKAENEQLKADVNRNHVEQRVMTAINDEKSGALPSATPYIVEAANKVFSWDAENKELVAKDQKGNVLYGADGATVMTPAEWLKSLEETSPFFFKQAQGGGAGGGGQGGGTLTPAQLAAMTPEQKMDYGRKHGLTGQ